MNYTYRTPDRISAAIEKAQAAEKAGARIDKAIGKALASENAGGRLDRAIEKARATENNIGIGGTSAPRTSYLGSSSVGSGILSAAKNTAPVGRDDLSAPKEKTRSSVGGGVLDVPKTTAPQTHNSVGRDAHIAPRTANYVGRDDLGAPRTPQQPTNPKPLTGFAAGVQANNAGYRALAQQKVDKILNEPEQPLTGFVAGVQANNEGYRALAMKDAANKTGKQVTAAVNGALNAGLNYNGSLTGEQQRNPKHNGTDLKYYNLSNDWWDGYNKSYEAVKSARTADEFNAAYKTFSDYYAEYEKWRGTIRSEEEIRADMETIDKLLRDSDRGQFGRGYGLAYGGDLDAYLKEEQEQEKLREQYRLLKEELGFSKNFVYDALSGNEDFALMSLPGESQLGTNFWQRLGDSDVQKAYDYINDIGGYREKIDTESEKAGSSLTPQFEAYKYMSEEQKSNFNYLYNTQGEETATEYLEWLKAGFATEDAWVVPSLNALQGLEMAKEFNTDTQRVLYGLRAGLDQFGSGMKQILTEEEVPTSAVQYAGQAARGELGKTGQFVYDTGMVTGNMLPSIALSYLGTVAGAPAMLANVFGSATLGLSAGGNAYNQALKEGYAPGEAKAYGTLVGASEASLQYLIGGIGRLGGVADDILLKKIAAIDKAWARMTLTGAVKIGGEVAEENLQEFIEPAIRSIVFDEKYNAPNMEELIYTTLLTVLTTGLMEGGNIISAGSEKPIDDGNVQTEPTHTEYSLVDKRIPTYDELISKPDIKVIDIRDNRGEFRERQKALLNKGVSSAVNTDTGERIFVTKKTFTHSFSNSEVERTAAAEKINDIIENAVLTHKQPSYKTGDNSTGVYTFFAAVLTDGGIKPVKLKVKEYILSKQDIPRGVNELLGSNDDTYATAYDSRVMVLDEIEKKMHPVTAATMPAKAGVNYPSASSAIRVADLLNLVNSEYRKYLPEKTDAVSQGKTANGEPTAIYAARLKELGRDYSATIYADALKRRSIERAQKIADKLGVGLKFESLGGNIRGKYKNGVITLNSDRSDPVMEVFVHELTHHLESSGNYDRLRRSALSYISENLGADVEAMKADIISEYAEEGIKLDEAGAERELVAQFCGEMLFADEESIIRLARTDRNLAQRIYDWICDTISKLGKDADARALIDARRMYENALRTVGNTQGGGARYSIAEIEGENGNYGKGVILDTDLFRKTKPRDWGKVLSEFVYKKLAGRELTMYDANGKPETVYVAKTNDRVTKDGASHNHKVIDKLARNRGDNIKSLATVHLSEALTVSGNETITNEHNHQWMDENGWTIRTAYLQDREGNIYEALLNIANGRDRRIIYSISNVKKIDIKKAATDGDVPSTDSGRGSHINNGYARSVSGGEPVVKASYGNSLMERVQKLAAKTEVNGKTAKGQFPLLYTERLLEHAKRDGNIYTQRLLQKQLEKARKNFGKPDAEISTSMPTIYSDRIKSRERNIFDDYEAKTDSIEGFEEITADLENDANGDTIGKKDFELLVNSKQLGKKIGKHASDFNLDPKSEKDRAIFIDIIRDIMEGASEIVFGPWRGQQEDVAFYIKDSDVVVTKQNGEFITVLKGGANNARVENARNR